MSGKFHAKDGLSFQRVDDGSVLVELVSAPDQPAGVRTVRLDASEWASVVASVSRRGDGRATWDAAMELHNSRPESS